MSNSCTGLRESTYIEKATESLNDVETTYRRLSEVIAAMALEQYIVAVHGFLLNGNNGSTLADQPIPNDIH